jgi:hypothetical protein
MNIMDTSLGLTIQRVMKNPTRSSFTWSAIVHAGGRDIPAIKVMNHDDNCDYFANVADETMLTLTLQPSLFFKYIYPNQEAIEVTVVKTPLGERGLIDPTGTHQSERYVATYIDRGNPIVQGTTANDPGDAATDLGDFVEIEFQLINLAVARMRLLPTGGVYRKMTPGDALRALLDTYSKQIKVDKLRLPQGVEMSPPNNTKVREQMVIPHGTMLLDVPRIFQEQFGIYSAGFSYYYCKDRWYVWPCYDVKRENIQTMKGLVIAIPPNRFPEADRTFQASGSLLTILATGDKDFSDDSNTLRANQGNGVRFASAANVMDGSMVQSNDNKAYLSRGLNNTETISTRNDSDYDNVLVSPTRVTSNPYLELSKMAGREGSTMSFVWDNSDPSYLYPGMPFTCYYLDKGNIKSLQGILVKHQSATRLNGLGMTELRYKTATVVTLYVNRNLESTS